jgi:uncharacterized membrane protein
LIPDSPRGVQKDRYGKIVIEVDIMAKKLSRSDIVKIIMETEDREYYLDEDMIRMMLDTGKIDDHNDMTGDRRTLSDVISDRMAMVAGSWAFLISFCIVIIIWIIVNTLEIPEPFDPYPYIFLNLILSCIAAIQAPMILMSQNRQDAKDRQRSENDFIVNMKSELMLEVLHDKLDKVIEAQNDVNGRLDRLESGSDDERP